MNACHPAWYKQHAVISMQVKYTPRKERMKITTEPFNKKKAKHVPKLKAKLFLKNVMTLGNKVAQWALSL